MEPEYSQADVDAIISAALGSLKDKKVLPLSFSDSKLLETLAELLPAWLGQADTQLALSELRNELYKNTSNITTQRLHLIAERCVACDGVVQSASLPRWNIVDPDLVMVLDSPSQLEYSESVDLLVEALKHAGFSSTRVMCTYAARCKFNKGGTPRDAYVNCSGYLYNELQLLKPKLIVAFGSIVYGIITGNTTDKFKEIYGSISWLGPFAIMGLASPAFILKNRDSFSDAVSYLGNDLKQAYAFCYGE